MISLEFDYFPANSIKIIDMGRILKAAAKRMIYLGLSCTRCLEATTTFIYPTAVAGSSPTYIKIICRSWAPYLNLVSKNQLHPASHQNSRITMSKGPVHIVATISPREGKVDRVSTSLSVIFDLHLETSFFTIRSMNRGMCSYGVFLGHRTLNRHGEIRQRKRA